MQRTTKLIKYAPPGILVFSLFLVYLNSMAPGLTWANDGSDGGDLITAAATGGVAHPTGYPVYLLLARLFQLLPIGSLAYRTNLMSALAAVFASLLVYYLVIRFLSSSDNKKWIGGLAAAYAFGLSPLIWSQAVITEVYALHALFVSLILYLSLDKPSIGFEKKWSDRLLGLIFGLALGNHITSILLFPVCFFHKPILVDENIGKFSYLRRFFWLAVGMLPYLILPLRALTGPPVNWGNPVTLNSFWWLISGKLYQGQIFALEPFSILSRVRTVAALLIEQFGIPGLVFGFVGLVVFYKPSALYKNMIWVVFAFSAFSIVYATRDSFMYLIPAFLCFAIWIGLGLSGLMNLLADLRFHKVAGVGATIFILYLFIMAGNHWSHVDASQDLRAEQFGAQALAKAPANAIVFVKGDKAIFALWYFHYALQNRPDLVVVAPDLLQFEWYQRTLLSTYPNLELIGPFPFAETLAVANPERSVCYIEYVQTTGINCLPLKTH